jgi:hypothetical protein
MEGARDETEERDERGDVREVALELLLVPELAEAGEPGVVGAAAADGQGLVPRHDDARRSRACQPGRVLFEPVANGDTETGGREGRGYLKEKRRGGGGGGAAVASGGVVSQLESGGGVPGGPAWFVSAGRASDRDSSAN